MKKNCSQCGEFAEVTWRYAYLVGGKEKRSTSYCKKCDSKMKYKSLRNKIETDPCYYYTNQTWKTLNQRCVNGRYAHAESIQKSPQMQSYHRKNIELHLTKDELRNFWYTNEDKVKEILLSGGIPSIDRIDDTKHYTLDNIQVLERMDNIYKSTGKSDNPPNLDKQTIKESNRRAYVKAQKEK